MDKKSSDVVWHELEIDKALRSSRHNQRAAVIWFTGLSGSGKSTSANAVEKALFHHGYKTYLLDGDNVRHGLCNDLGFSDEDRVENIRRVAEVAKLMVDAGLIVLTSFISPFRSDRDMARSLLEENEFVEVHVNASLSECEKRDPKGLYKKAREGKIKNFTGIDSPYEPPENPEIIVDTENLEVEEVAERIISVLREMKILN